MVITTLVFIGGFILNTVALALTGIGLALPIEIPQAFTWFFSKIHYLNGIFPIDTMVSAAVFVVTVWTFKYTVKVMLWIISFVPGIKHNTFPSMSESDTTRYKYVNGRKVMSGSSHTESKR